MPLTRSGSAAADAKPLSAASDAERQYFSCNSAREPANTGFRLSSAIGRAKSGLERDCVAAKQLQIPFAGAHDDRRLLDDGARNGVDAGGLGQSRG